MSHRVQIVRSAEREFEALQPEMRGRITTALQRLADEPRPRSARKLAHGRGWWLRVGEYRVIYTVDDKEHMVTIYAIGHRRDIYRR